MKWQELLKIDNKKGQVYELVLFYLIRKYGPLALDIWKYLFTKPSRLIPKLGPPDAISEAGTFSEDKVTGQCICYGA